MDKYLHKNGAGTDVPIHITGTRKEPKFGVDFGRLGKNTDAKQSNPAAQGDAAKPGSDPKQSVCDSHGRSHDHENLFVVGAPTLPTGGCTNGTLTFAALTLRSAPEIARAS